MIKVFDFRCKKGHIFEKFVSNSITTTRCGCGSIATKVLSATKCVLDGSSPDFPGRHQRWIREHEEAGKRGREAQREESQTHV